MPKFRMGKWEPDEIKLLKKIPRGEDSKNALEKLAKKLNRPYSTTYQKWHGLHIAKMEQNERRKAEPVEVAPMELEVDVNFVLTKVGVDDKERIAFEQGLESKLDLIRPSVGAITVQRKFEKIARVYLEKAYPERKYVFATIKGNPKVKRLARKY